MLQDSPKWTKLAKIVQYSQITKVVKRAHKLPKWSNPPRFAKMDQSGPARLNLAQSVLSGPQWTRVLLNAQIYLPKICPVCEVVSCRNTKTTLPPLFPVDTRCTCWADKVAQEEMGGRGEGGVLAGKCKFPFTPPPSPSPGYPSRAQLVPWRAIIPIYALICLCRGRHIPP